MLGGSAIQFGNLLVSGTVLGSIIGLLQWLVLRRYLQAAGWWILAMAITSAVSLPWAGSVGIGGLMAVPLTRGLTGLIVGAMTGIVLAWLMRKPQKF